MVMRGARRIRINKTADRRRIHRLVMQCLIFRPTTNAHRDELPADDDFWKHSHAAGPDEHTMCSIAPEEWDYDRVKPAKKITCPECLRQIRWAKQFKA